MVIIEGKEYKTASNLVRKDNCIPLTYWTLKPNFGDLLSPYLIEKLTSEKVVHVYNRPRALRNRFLTAIRKCPFSYFAIGSIIRRVNPHSVVWGSGAFGTEGRSDFDPGSSYLAVRGPLTRNLLRIYGIDCPEVYGDPALLMPYLFKPVVKKKYSIGVILRWSEDEWDHADYGSDVKKINMSSTDIEATLTDMLSCERILSSSLHGVILADAYGIPSAWLASTTPKGLHFKFYDYFLSVEKVQKPQVFDFSAGKITCSQIDDKIHFDSRKIVFNPINLLEASPFIEPV